MQLTIRGLRSYTAEQTIDFSDVGLLAILGDTGAGKSSILEALCFALYGGCTWDKRNAAVLIADGVPSMQVRLTFVCGNQTWQVTRSAFRATSPASRHELICLDTGQRYDTKQQVNSTIERLLGLTHDAFLKAVVLPQGRFQALLHTNREDRTAILKGLLGIDLLDTVRAEAIECHDRLRPQLDVLHRDRDRLLPDPAAAAETAAKQLAVAAGRRDRLQKARQEHSTASRNRDQARALATAATTHADRLRQHRLTAGTGDLHRLSARAEEIGLARRQVMEAIGVQEKEVQRAEEEIAIANGAGRSPTALVNARTVLQAARRRLPGLIKEQRRLADVERKLAGDRTVFEQQQPVLDGLDAAATAADTEANTAAETVGDLQRRLTDARALVQQLRRRHAALHRAEKELTELKTTAEATQADILNVEEAIGVAELRQREAEEMLNAAVRASSAVFAASTCTPGDPCPICERSLPPDYAAPRAPEQGPLDEAVEARRQDLLDVQLRRAGHQATLSEQNKQANRLETKVNTKRTELAETRAQLQRLLELDTAPTDDVADDDLFRDLVQQLSDAGERKTVTAEKAQTARDAATVARTARDATGVALKRRYEELATDQKRLNDEFDALAASILELPALYHLAVPLHDESLERMLGRIAVWSIDAEKLANHHTDLSSGLGKLREQQAELATRHLEQVERAAAPIEQQLRTLYSTLRNAVDTLGLTARIPALPAFKHWTEHLSEVAEWGADLETIVEETAQTLAATATQAAGEVTRHERAAAAVLDTAGAPDANALDDAWAQAVSDANRAESDLTRARRELPIAADLDDRITRATPVVEALREVASLLANAQFPALVVAKRQRAFLGLATEQLLAMSGRRFAFAEDFRIIDRHTGQPRDVRTLSGGETFQASLSLALAVVQLAGRAGGRVDALFLDEGFGTLDADSLDDAIEALSRQTLGGRLVAVITHMRAVAERIDNVLVVSRTSSGSQVAWATAAERASLVDEDLQEGLLP
ncbi:SMC family ATPase [Micromonospora sp. HUAS YX12]|uniref:Nuclease SbcCD subunit C n=1 Tax=Micromonospora sp. HUAS YX12 TaxID=3156396 RepID=A0AAU7QV17_9ACTN